MILDHALYALQILCAYLAVCVFLPSLLLRRFVRGRGAAYRFVFYQAIANVYLNLVCFALAYCKIFSAFSLWLLLVFLPLGAAVYLHRQEIRAKLRRGKTVLADMLAGTFGGHQFTKGVWGWLKKRCLGLYRRYFEHHLLEWAMLLAGAAYLIFFYGQYKLNNAGYGHTDEETHLYWIQSIFENTPFPTGLYPHGMHFLLASLCGLFGISAVGGYLNFSLVSVLFIFWFLYLAFREIFRTKYAALFGWAFFLLTDLFQSVTYFRFQFCFPMEFGLVPLAGMLLGLVAYLRRQDKTAWLLIAACIAWGFYVHFYVTIVAAVICAAFGIVFLIPLIQRKALHKVLAAGILGIVLAVLPFGVGYVAGHPFERSISWALGVMDGNIPEVGEASPAPEQEKPAQEEKKSLREKLPDLDALVSYLKSNCFGSSFGARLALTLCCGMFGYGLVGALVSRKHKIRFLLYLFLALCWAFVMVLYLCYFLDLPVLVEMKRSSMFLSVFSIPLFAFPAQLAADFIWLIGRKGDFRRAECVVLTVLGLCFLSAIWERNWVKRGRYYEITISEADARLCMDLLERDQPFTWTVISPTNDLSMIRRDGYHYEVLDLLEDLDRGISKFYIPTKFIYVVVEDRSTNFVSSRREIDGSDRAKMSIPVSPEAALDDSIDVYNAYGESRDRAYYFQRNIVMSRLYYWMEEIKQAYPQEVSVYYQDSTCTVYQIEQDEYFLLNLAVKYREELERMVEQNEKA